MRARWIAWGFCLARDVLPYGAFEGEPQAVCVIDRRERVVATVEEGTSRREGVERFAQEGRIALTPIGGDRRSHAIEAQTGLIVRIYEARPNTHVSPAKLSRAGSVR